uniref:DUF1279 domain-containing protein n=1 Tax=Panagrolaimus sp. JU765 TaxID=591449 RepID=A0AC34Q7C2_9BILA
MIAQKCFQTYCVNSYRLSVIRPLKLWTISQQSRLLSSTSGNDSTNKRCPFNYIKLSSRFSSLSKDEKDVKKTTTTTIELTDETPAGFYAKCKYYFKQFGYIAIPVHCVSSTLWLCAAYLLVKSGVDVIALLQWLHVPEFLVEKVKNTPETAGVLVVTLLLYKIIAPLRYATTLAGIQLSFWTLRRLGKLKTAKEIQVEVRAGYEKYQQAIRRLNERRITNIAAFAKKLDYITSSTATTRKYSNNFRFRDQWNF